MIFGQHVLIINNVIKHAPNGSSYDIVSSKLVYSKVFLFIEYI